MYFKHVLFSSKDIKFNNLLGSFTQFTFKDSSTEPLLSLFLQGVDREEHHEFEENSIGFMTADCFLNY